MTRVQWPVGQGCFSTGAIETTGGRLHYVYDCGARSVSNLEPVVAAYARRTPHIDALFISHLDGDHVDGLDTLLARLDAVTVYLPYLSTSQRLMALAAAEAEDRRLTASFVQAQFDPALWFGSRGVQRVVFVRNGDDPELVDGDEAARPVSDPWDDGPRVLTLKELGRMRMVESGTPGTRAALLEMEVDGHIAFHVGATALDWILRPFVPRVSDDRTRQFQAKVMAALGRAHNKKIDSAALQVLLKTRDGRVKLRRCYDAILTDGGGQKHNAVSMSLYSGPGTDANRWAIHMRGNEGAESTFCDIPNPGWIGAGDAKLKATKTRQKWRSYYRAELGRTMTMLLPHHGSKANFHLDLLKAPLSVCIASADEPHEGYRHPSAEVVEAVDEQQLVLIHVTKRLASRFRETVQLIGPRNATAGQP